MSHHLLQNQFKKYFGSEMQPEQFQEFLKIVRHSYPNLDPGNTKMNRTVDLNSAELLELNNLLKIENEQRKRAAEEISAQLIVARGNEEKFRSFFDNACDPLFLLDANQQIIDCNHAAIKILGAENKARVLNRQLTDFSPELQPDGQLSADKLRDFGKPDFAHDHAHFEWMNQRTDGTLFPVDVSLSVIPAGNKSIFLMHWCDISSKKEAEIKLRQQNEELKKANYALDKFVYSVSHDLRAPLSSMLGIVQLTEEDCEDLVIKENLGLVKRNILKMDAFIQDILSYARNNRQEVKHDEIRFKELIEDITGNLKYMSGTKGNIHVEVNISQDIAFKSDNSRLSIILNNLISNAIRYHDPSELKPFVKVDVNTNEKEALIIVSDNGIGIRKDFQQKVFDMFYRVSESSEGSGLGLYIVKEAVDKLNGKIAIESEPGVGTKFNIIIPNINNVYGS